jgi:hypothetical protein
MAVADMEAQKASWVALFDKFSSDGRATEPLVPAAMSPMTAQAQPLKARKMTARQWLSFLQRAHLVGYLGLSPVAAMEVFRTSCERQVCGVCCVVVWLWLCVWLVGWLYGCAS